LVDVGGESTRPGAAPVTAEEELRRVLPVVRELCAEGVPVSVDTSKAEVAARCLEAGAVVVNDVTAMRSPEMVRVCADFGCTVCLMHMKGEPRTMQQSPTYSDVVREVKEFLVHRAEQATEAGVKDVWIDPGIGFGKTLEHNLQLISATGEFAATGFPVLIGVSRKSFIGRLLGDAPVEARLEGSLAAQVVAQCKGARIVRAHDVAAAHNAALVAGAVLSSG
jgi:dihydropteroate synthase